MTSGFTRHDNEDFEVTQRISRNSTKAASTDMKISLGDRKLPVYALTCTDSKNSDSKHLESIYTTHVR